MKQIKRLSALILSFALVLSVISVVWAEGSKPTDQVNQSGDASASTSAEDVKTLKSVFAKIELEKGQYEWAIAIPADSIDENQKETYELMVTWQDAVTETEDEFENSGTDKSTGDTGEDKAEEQEEQDKAEEQEEQDKAEEQEEQDKAEKQKEQDKDEKKNKEAPNTPQDVTFLIETENKKDTIKIDGKDYCYWIVSALKQKDANDGKKLALQKKDVIGVQLTKDGESFGVLLEKEKAYPLKDKFPVKFIIIIIIIIGVAVLFAGIGVVIFVRRKSDSGEVYSIGGGNRPNYNYELRVIQYRENDANAIAQIFCYSMTRTELNLLTAKDKQQNLKLKHTHLAILSAWIGGGVCKVKYQLKNGMNEPVIITMDENHRVVDLPDTGECKLRLVFVWDEE